MSAFSTQFVRITRAVGRRAGDILPDEFWQAVRWWYVVGAVAITPINFGRLELTNETGPDTLKWALRAPFWFLPLVIIIPRWGSMLSIMRRPPISWMLAWAYLSAVSVLWAIDAQQAVLVGLGIAGLTTLAVWQVADRGWESFASAVVVALTTVVAAGVLLDLKDGIFIHGRSGGLTTGATTQGRLAALAIVMSAGLLWTRRYPRVLWITPVICAAAVWFTETRTAIIATAAGLAYGGLRRLQPQNRRLLIGGTIVGGLALVLVAASYTGIGELGARGDPASFAGRTSIWPIAISKVLERPLLGYGTGSNELVYIQVARDGELTFLAGTSHSLYISPYLTGGIIGGLLLTTAALSAVRHRRSVEPWIVAPLISILISGLTESLVHIPSVTLIILAGCLTAISTARDGAAPPTSARYRGTVSTLP